VSGPSSAYFVCGGRWHDIDFARVEILKLLGEHPDVRTRVAEVFRDTEAIFAFGLNGVEYFAHSWEVGARKAKEMLFTGEAISATEAKSMGMVNRVVERDQLASYTLELAKHIALRPSMGLKLAKQSVNQMQDAQGLWTSLQAAMSLQQLGHSHNQQLYKIPVDPAGLKIIREQAKAGREGKQD